MSGPDDEPLKFKVYTFKLSGKWVYEGEISMTQEQYYVINRYNLIEMNGGSCPGMSTKAEQMHIVLIPDGDHSFPRMFPWRD